MIPTATLSILLADVIHLHHSLHGNSGGHVPPTLIEKLEREPVSGPCRHTVRARCRNTAARPPLGRMKFLSGGRCRSYSSIHAHSWGLADNARRVTYHSSNPRFLSCLAPCDVASSKSICQAHCPHPLHHRRAFKNPRFVSCIVSSMESYDVASVIWQAPAPPPGRRRATRRTPCGSASSPTTCPAASPPRCPTTGPHTPSRGYST